MKENSNTRNSRIDRIRRTLESIGVDVKELYYYKYNEQCYYKTNANKNLGEYVLVTEGFTSAKMYSLYDLGLYQMDYHGADNGLHIHLSDNPEDAYSCDIKNPRLRNYWGCDICHHPVVLIMNREDDTFEYLNVEDGSRHYCPGSKIGKVDLASK